MSRAVYKLSSIARPLDTNYRSNVAVLIIMPCVAMLIGGLEIGLREASFSASINSAFTAAIVTFLTWALGRELDPDHNETAFIAMALSVVAMALGWMPAVWTLALALMANRLISRTVGLPARITDMALVIGLAAMSVFKDGYWAMGAVAGLAMAYDLYFDRKRTLNFVFATLATGLSAFAVVQNEGDWSELIIQPLASLDPLWGIAVALTGLISVAMALTMPLVTSNGDATEKPLSTKRVRGGILITLLLGFSSLLSGQEGFMASLPVWAGFIGLIIVRFLPKSGAKNA